jgi:hypothetical protein
MCTRRKTFLKTPESDELDLNFLKKAGKSERLSAWREALAQARS